MKKTLIFAYKNNIYGKLKDEIQEISSDPPYQLENDKLARWATTWWQQFTVLLQRGLKERKHESFSGFNIAEVLVVSFIIGLLWWKSDMAHLQDKVIEYFAITLDLPFLLGLLLIILLIWEHMQIGLLFFISGFWCLFPLYQAIFTFPQERMMLEKERSSGMYRLSSYFMSRIIGDLPMELILPTVFIIITYWMAGLKPTAGHFFHTLFVVMFCVLVSQGLGLSLGALVMDSKTAALLGSVITLAFLLASGFYVQNVPPFISWIKYISSTYYTYKLFLGSQYKPDETYSCGDQGNVCLVGDFPSIKNVGLDGQILSAVAMAIMIVFYRLIAYLALMRIGVAKKLEK